MPPHSGKGLTEKKQAYLAVLLTLKRIIRLNLCVPLMLRAGKFEPWFCACAHLH